jgi:hypothetical protein
MPSYLYYNQSTGNKDPRSGGGISLNPLPRGLTVGDERPIAIPINNPEEDDDFEDIDLDVDDDIQHLLFKKIDSPKTADSVGRRTDVAYYGSPGISIFEKYTRQFLSDAKTHTTTARKGISPFPQSNFSGPAIGAGSADQAFRTTGNYFYDGTQFGTSRAPLPRHDEDDDPLLFDEELPEPMERAFNKHQGNIKKIHKIVDNLEKQEKTSYLSSDEDKYST